MSIEKEDLSLSSQKNVPIILVTGFFGAGKTTLVKELIKSTTKKIGIVENDLAEINIDGKILSLTPGNVEIVSNVCICCSKGLHVSEAIDKLLTSQPDIEYIIIESTGLANPKNITDNLYAANIKHGLKVVGICCVVDAKNYFNHSKIKEQNQQIIYSDTIIVSKLDLVKDDKHISDINKSLLQLNPTASVKGVINGQISLDELARFIIAGRYSFIPPSIDLGESIHKDISTFSYTWDKDVKPLKIVMFLKNFVETGDFIRAKGIFKFPLEPDMYIFQAVEKDVILTQEPGNGTHKSSMVFIGTSLDKKDIIQKCEDCIL